MYKTPFGKSGDIIILSDCKIDMHNLVIVVKSKVYQCVPQITYGTCLEKCNAD